MWLAACSQNPDARSPAAAPPRSAGASEAAAATPGAAAAKPTPSSDDQFLVLTGDRELVLRTAHETQSVLARDIASALYDPRLELVWLEGESLRVLDLRQPTAEPLVIVREWPGTSALSIRHPASLVSSNDTCDVGDLASLTWDENPKLERVGEESGELPLESKEWLRAQLKRTARAKDDAAYDLRSVESRIDLPPSIGRCDEADDECGRFVRFGPHDLQLVLVATLVGDCWHPFCMFHDPQTGEWSSPLPGDLWKGDAGNRPGPCGPYAFDASGRAFSNDNRLCGPGERCQAIDGQVLGWRNPGSIVGAPGDMDLMPESE
jgi:hypothetical protein